MIVWLLLALGAWGQEVTPWYNPDVFEQQEISDLDKQRLPEGIVAYQQRSPVKSITIRDRDGSSRKVEFDVETLQNEPWPIIEGISVALDERQRGSEWDFVVRDNGKRTLVTVRWNEGDHWDIELADPFDPVPAKAPTASQLQATYQIGEFESREGARWDALSRARLGESLKRLSADELRVLEDVPMMRAKTSDLGERGQRHAAEYVMDEDGSARMWLLDRAFLDPGGDWAGPIDDPAPDAMFSLLHEVGHAVAFHPVRMGRIETTDAVTAYNAAVPSVQKAIAAYNELVDRVNRTPSVPERTTLVTEAQQLQAELEALTVKADELGAQAESLVKRQNTWEQRSPVIAAWLEVVGTERFGPTPYGRTHVHEGFADAFALYKVDPAALERAMPEAFAWFEAGSHTEAMRITPPPG